MDKLENARAKAERYRNWYEQDGLKDTLNDIKQAYMESMVSSNPKDVERREVCYVAANLIGEIEGRILKVIGGGKVADKELQSIEKNKKVIKLF